MAKTNSTQYSPTVKRPRGTSPLPGNSKTLDKHQQTGSKSAGGAMPTTVANTGNAADRRGNDSEPLPLADRTEIERSLQQWRAGIQVDIQLLIRWSGRLAETIPPKSMDHLRELKPELLQRSFLCLAFDWEGSREEIMGCDQITKTFFDNLQKALRRYAQQAIDLISSKWTDKGLQPTAFASRMGSVGQGLEHDVFQMLRDGVSAFGDPESLCNLEAALSTYVRGYIATEIERYDRNAQLIGLSELLERDVVEPECRGTNETISELEVVSTSPLPAGDHRTVDQRFPKMKRMSSEISSPLAARRMEAFLDKNNIGQTEFASRADTTDRTLRKFRHTGKVRRNIFDAIALAMGTTREELLKSE